MVIQFFKNNNPASFIILPLLAIIMWIPGLSVEHSIAANNGMPLYDILALPLVATPIISALLAIILIVSEAFLLNFILNENEIISTPSYLPALFYIVFMSSNKTFMTLHPILFANLFVLFGINKLVSSYRKNHAFSQVFDAGLLFSIATLFYFPSIILLPLLGIALQIFRPLIWREWVITLIGVIIPYVFTFMYYFWFDKIDYLWYMKIYTSFSLNQTQLDSSPFYYGMIGVGSIIIALSTIRLFNNFHTTSQKTKKGTLLFKWFLVFSLITATSTYNFLNSYFAYIAIPAVVFCTNYFLHLKKQWWGEFLFSLFLLAIFCNHLFN